MGDFYNRGGGSLVLTDLEVDGTTVVVDETNDRVGIGTDSPQVQLDVHDTTTSSANTGGALRLSANDGSPMGDSHRLGVVEFTGAEDSSNTQVVGARIEALTDAAWTNAENGTALYFYTTDGNASQTNVLKLDSNTKATFAGEIEAASLDISGDCDIDGTLEADAITVEGANLTAIYSPIAGSSSITTTGTVGTGTWQGTAVASAYLDADTAHLSGAQTFSGTKTLNSFKGTGGATVTNILDEDAMGSNSATALATQQSIKAYADTKGVLAGSSSITTVGTVGTGTWQGTAVASAYLDADTAHLSGTQTFTGTKTLNSFKGTGGATVTNILDEDAMGTNSATALATQQSIKAYADTKSPVAGHSSIATVGTIGTGTWQGTAVASAYLDADTAHLSGTQTFTGTKTLQSFKGTGGATVTNILDEDAMGTNSATALATQQSIKAYADTKSVIAGSSSITTVGTVGTGTWQGTAVASAYLDADTAHLSGTQTFSGAKTFSADVVIGGATPQLTIGDAGAEDTFLVFDGNAQDYRIGIDDGTDTLEIGLGAAHGTTPVVKIDSATNLQLMHNSAVADGQYSGTLTMYQAGEDLTAGEVVYFKSDGKVWKAVATAVATSRCVAMAMETTSADAMGPFLLKGFARFNSEFPTWTIGGALFTPEAETSSKNVPEQAAPDTDGDFVQVIGYAVSADAVYFDPDSTVIEVA